MKESLEGNFYIQQYNHKLVKARDEVDEELDTKNKELLEAKEQVMIVTKEVEMCKAKFEESKRAHICKVECLNNKVDQLEEKLHKCLSCDVCNDDFESNIELQRHMKIHHKQNVREVKGIK